jgi:hypothetical protein
VDGRDASRLTSVGLSRRDAPLDELTFVTTSPTEVSASGTIVRLYIAHGDGPELPPHGLLAELRPWRRAGTPVTRVLAHDATGFRARYLSSLFGQRSWLDSWVSTSVLPAAVELRIAFDSASASDTTRAAHALLAQPMLIPLGARQ